MNIFFSHVLTATLSLFAIIDIVGSIPLLISAKQKQKGFNSLQITLISGLIMIAFLFAGTTFLGFFGLSEKDFALAGSLVIFLLGLEMVLGRDIFHGGEDHGGRSSSIIPIAFPLIAGSGTLTTIMSLHSEYRLEEILVAIILNLIFIYSVLKLLNPIEQLLGPSGLLVIRKFFGVILLAIAVKLFITSWHAVVLKL